MAASVGVWSLTLPAASVAASGEGGVSALTSPSVTLEPAGFASGSSESPRGAVEVAWDSVATATRYTVRYRDADASPTPGFTEVVTTATRLVIADLDEDVTYEVQVVASDGTTSSAPSASETAGAVIAPGGSLLDVAGTEYVVHTFAASGSVTLARTAVGIDVEYLLVGGGGGGGGGTSTYGNAGGGGGGGGVRTGTVSAATGTLTVTVGQGGAGHDGATSDPFTGTAGGSTTLAEIGGAVATAGGGSGGTRGQFVTGGTGGKGGAAGSPQSLTGANGPYRHGGGGSGAGGSGTVGSADGAASPTGGDGGIGLESGITGTTLRYGAGGGGGSPEGSAGLAGDGGGGVGAYSDGAAEAGPGNGVDGRGGGGGGGNDASYRTGGSGGDGVAILRYALPVAPAVAP